jgi:hypothetical protein
MQAVVLEERRSLGRFRGVAADAMVEHGVGIDLKAGGM